jgi:DNA-binding LacI/PurR family transcriptional regulator
LEATGPEVSNVTIYDVADQAKVSIATVSRVLNAPHRVNEQTRHRVLETIDALGYVPKAEATARARRLDKRIGILAPFFTYPAFVQRLRGIADALVGTASELVIYNVDTAQRFAGYLATLPISRRLDGLILMSVIVDQAAVKRIHTHGLQTVMIETSNPSLSGVEIDNERGGELAAEFLIDKGHRRIGFVGGDIEIPNCTLRTSELRLAGLRQSMAEAGLPMPDEYVRHCDDDLESAREQARTLFELPEPPTAVFAANDTLALGVTRAAREHGLHIPDDVAVIGFDNLDVADHIGLTTVDQSLTESGRVAVELLQARLADPTRSIQHVRLPLRVVERETV